MVFYDKDIEYKDLGGNVCRKVLAHGGSMLSARVTFKKGSIGAIHTHPHEQIGYVLSGSFELNMNGEKTIITAGDTYYTEPDFPHGVVALEDGELLDIFTPQREDFLD